MRTAQKEIEERTRLAGSNKFELLLFRLGESPGSGQRELFGINVFTVREVLVMPAVSVLPLPTVTWASPPRDVVVDRFSVTAPPVFAIFTIVPSTKLLAAAASVITLAAVPLFWKAMVRGAMA